MRGLGFLATVLLLASCGSDDSSEAGGATTAPESSTAAAPEGDALALDLLPLTGPEYGSAATVGQRVDFYGVVVTVDAIEAGPPGPEPSILVTMTVENTTDATAAVPSPLVQCAVGEAGDRSLPPDGSPIGTSAGHENPMPFLFDAGESVDGTITVTLPDCGENVPVVITRANADADHTVRAYWDVPAEAQA